MSRQKYILLVLLSFFLSVAVIMGVMTYPSAIPQQAASFPLHKHYRMRIKLSNDTSSLVKDGTLTVRAPYSLLANQKLVEISSSAKYETIKDDFGNQYLIFNHLKLTPFQKKQIDLRISIDMSLSAQGIYENDIARFLEPSQFIESNNIKIKQLSAQLSNGDDRDSLLAMYNWIKGNVKYPGYIREDRGALYALEHLEGDCTEYAYLMAALARASNIPARVMTGFFYENSAVIRGADQHNWTEVYLDGKWEIVDAQKGHFMNNASAYVSFGIINPNEKNYGSSHRILQADKRLKVAL